MVYGTQTQAQSRSYSYSDRRISISKDGPPPPQPVRGNVTRIDIDGTDTRIEPRIPLPAFRIADYLNLNDASLVYHMATRDTMEIAMAQLAQSKATSQSVRDYAIALERDRTVRLGKVIHVLNDHNTGSVAKTDDYALARMHELFVRFSNEPSSPTWDVNFMKVMFFQKQNEIDVLSENRVNVAVEDVRDRVDYSLRMLTTERELARNILNGFGATLP